MNPDKLFDYLDGKLSPADRTALEEKLMSDAQLRAQFHIAREIHRSGGKSREVVVPSDDPATVERSGRLGRRIAIGAIILVFANVFIGLAVIAAKNKKPAVVTDGREAEIRRQLSASLGAAAQNAMPPPSFAAAEISLIAPRAEWENAASRVTGAAEKLGGSAVKGLPDENVLTVVVDIPSNRETEFRQAVAAAPISSPVPTPDNAVQPNERTIVQVHIAETAR